MVMVDMAVMEVIVAMEDTHHILTIQATMEDIHHLDMPLMAAMAVMVVMEATAVMEADMVAMEAMEA